MSYVLFLSIRFSGGRGLGGVGMGILLEKSFFIDLTEPRAHYGLGWVGGSWGIGFLTNTLRYRASNFNAGVPFSFGLYNNAFGA